MLANWNNSSRIDIALHSRTHYSDSEPTSLCSCYIVLCGEATHTKFIVLGLTQPGLRSTTLVTIQGRIQDFKLGGAHLKKLCRAEGGAKIFGVFRVKNHDFTKKNHIFSNFRGGAPRVRPPWIRPWICQQYWQWNSPARKHCRFGELPRYKR